MATVIEEQTSTVWKKSNPISFILFTYLHVFSTLSTQGRNGDYGMKILMAQKWSWKSLTYSTFKLKNLSTGSVDMVSYNSLKNFLQLNEKFQNFRRKSHLCILVCFSTTREKKIRILLLCNFFKWTKVKNIAGISFWISNWERFVTNVRPHAPSMDFNKTAGPVEQCALVGRAHPLQFLQIQTTEEPNNRN